MKVPFNRPTVAPNQLEYVSQSFASGHLSGDGPFTARASKMLSELHNGSKVLLTTSCTSALELSAILLDIQDGDEVIVPSFTFVSSANAFVIMGARIVFAEVESETLSVSVRTVENLITSRTRAIVAVNYGGHPSVTDELVTLAKQHNIMIIEDNAHGLFANDEGVPLGTKAALSTLSFHETKNITCGEGGALVINDPSLVERAEIIREKGTNRSLFFRGMIDKYTWVDKGSSYLMSDINAALLTAQLEHAAIIQRNRHETFRLFMEGLADWSSRSGATLPYHLASEDLSAHLFPILMPNLDSRSDLIDFAKGRGIGLTFHYVPLHLSPGGLRYGRTNEDDFSVTKKISDTLVRLPLYAGLTAHDIEEIIETVAHFDVQ
jgi:dTDP-4-amino-4,6-dideoxygalactose transaminase